VWGFVGKLVRRSPLRRLGMILEEITEINFREVASKSRDLV
jgi:hypothetical protein